MKYGRFSYIFVFIFILVAGCQGAKFPLGDVSSSTIDDNLIGSWVMTNIPEDAEGGSNMNIYAFDDHAYYVEAWDKDDRDDMLKMNVFTTEVQGVLFANIRCVNCDEDDRDEYFFFNYNLGEDGDLGVRSIDENLYNELSKLKSSKEVRSFFEQRMLDDDFYESEIAVYRRGDTSS